MRDLWIQLEVPLPPPSKEPAEEKKEPRGIAVIDLMSEDEDETNVFSLNYKG